MTTRTLLVSDPFAQHALPTHTYGTSSPTWPGKWVRPGFTVVAPALVAFRRAFALDAATTVRLHVSADERYELYCDGKLVGRGPDFGDQENWYYDTYELSLTAGEHVLVARVMMLAGKGPSAQVTLDWGLLVGTDPGSPLQEKLATGLAAWQCKALNGYQIGSHNWWDQAFGAVTLDTSGFAWDWKTGGGEGWTDAEPGGAASIPATTISRSNRDRLLRPAILPEQHSKPIPLPQPRHVSPIAAFESNAQPFAPQAHLAAEARSWSAVPVTIPAHTTRRILFDLAEYYCFYYRLRVSGGRGAKLRIAAAETLFLKPGQRYSDSPQGRRDAVDNLHWIGLSDTFILDGGAGRELESLWWRCGKFVQLVISTGDEPLTVEALELTETRYPLALQSRFTSSDPRLESLVPMCFRTLQACCHEIYMDCPYYEQQQWVGDMRVQILCHYVATDDSRPAQKALQLISGSQSICGLTTAFYPAMTRLVIPGFSLWFIACVHDLALWRGERELIGRLVPAARSAMENILRHRTGDGLLCWPPGWAYTDWASGWKDGNPPASTTAEGKVESVYNLQAVLVLQMLAAVEEYLGEPELAARWKRLADGLFARCRQAFWDAGRGVFAVDLEHTSYCEHSQCMAVLTGRLSEEEKAQVAKGLLTDTTLTKAQVFYSYYLFEAYRELGQMEALLKHMGLWHSMAADGFRTTPETYPSGRSDCHAWAAHPLYHYFASILGIRPASMGFETVQIRPQLGSLTEAAGEMVHPKGTIKASFRMQDGRLTGSVTLPPGLRGTLVVNGKTYPLGEGCATF